MEVINYNKSSISLTNSVLKYFNIKPFHNTLPEIDLILEEKKYKNVIIFVADGLGSKNLNDNLSKNSFLRKNKYMDISTVFPSTTTASTTSILTGLTPSEHNWFGWTMYFKDTNETLSLYSNKDKESKQDPKKNVLDRSYMKYKTIIDLIREKGENEAYYAYPFDKEDPCLNIDSVCKKIKKLCKSDKKKFIYAYIEDPDWLLHKYGVYSKKVKDDISNINEKVEELSKTLKDTIIFLTADHGLVSTKYINLEYDLNELYCMLERTTSIESRACGIKLKNNVNKDDFLNLYEKKLKDKFLLLTYDSSIKMNLFGFNKNNYLKDTIGDYLLVATSNYSINYNNNSPIFKANHAGLTVDETTVPIILIDCK